MSRLDDFMARAEKAGKATLDDHLTQQGFLDPARRKSMRAQVTRALKPGGPYRALAEKGIIAPTLNTRGRKADWEIDLKALPNRHEIALASDAFAPIREMDLQDHPVAVRQQITALKDMNLTGKAGAQVAQTVTTLAYEYQLERDSHRHAQQLYEMELRHHQDTRQTLERILGLLESGEGKLVPLNKGEETENG